MKDMILIKPSMEYAVQIEEFKRDMLTVSKKLQGCACLENFDNTADWLDYLETCSNAETTPEGLVVSTQFIYVRQFDKKIVGTLNFRHYLNDFLRNYGGNIGYSVCPSEWKKGYAKAMLKEALPYGKTIGLEKVMLACDEDNIGSKKTILSNGGVYDRTIPWYDDGTPVEQYWITL